MKYEVRLTSSNFTEQEGADYLRDYGYADVVPSADPGTYECSRIGVVLPDIQVLSELRYGPLIREERERMGLSRENLSNVLLISPDVLQNVEDGGQPLSDAQLQMAANTLHLVKNALEDGKRVEAVHFQDLSSRMDDMEGRMAVMREQYLYFDAEFEKLREREGFPDQDVAEKYGVKEDPAELQEYGSVGEMDPVAMEADAIENESPELEEIPKI